MEDIGQGSSWVILGECRTELRANILVENLSSYPSSATHPGQFF